MIHPTLNAYINLNRNNPALDYFGAKTWPGAFGSAAAKLENIPRSQWPVRNGHEDEDADETRDQVNSAKLNVDAGLTDASEGRSPSHWAELTNRW